jgi:hypothetical protein
MVDNRVNVEYIKLSIKVITYKDILSNMGNPVSIGEAHWSI